LYAWEASLDGEGLLSITVTWQVPVPGGFEYVRDTPIVAMNPGDFTLLVFSDITPTADTTLAAAGYTLTGVWPTVP
jgi:hypothetical protein